ncbi:MAG TPA: tRNA pseudouridine(55) synthase TruB [Acidobacteriaceae bacterium]|nr:tRNA pseudouridine(55) synthase TruB [Acidobacteriaceae bacterium]
MNGLLVVNKSAGMTSHDVVSRVRKMTGESSIGHLGTLDPMATGVLPLLLGRYTRLAQFFRQDSKRYTGIIRFGFATDTYDAEGSPVNAGVTPDLTLAGIRHLAEEFEGMIQQMPPPFSAKKLQGVPAYKLARAGKPVELRAVSIAIRRFDILDYRAPDAWFSVEVSSGGYIRSIAHELGVRAGCGAHLAALCREEAGAFTLNQAATLEQVAEWMKEDSLGRRLPHPRLLLPEMPSVTVNDGTAMRLRNGMACNLPEYSAAPTVKIFTSQIDLFGVGRRLAGTLIQPMAVLAA